MNKQCIDAIPQGSCCPTGSLVRKKIGVEDARINIDAAFGHCWIPSWSAVPAAHEMLQAECRPSFDIIYDSDLAWTQPEFLHPLANVVLENWFGSPLAEELADVTLEVLSPVVDRHSL